MTTKTALITGASRGLGLALATALAERGWHLIINARGEDQLTAVSRTLSQHTSCLLYTSPSPRDPE